MKVPIRRGRIFGIQWNRDRVFADEMKTRLDTLKIASHCIANQMPTYGKEISKRQFSLL